MLDSLPEPPTSVEPEPCSEAAAESRKKRSRAQPLRAGRAGSPAVSPDSGSLLPQRVVPGFVIDDAFSCASTRACALCALKLDDTTLLCPRALVQ